MGFGHKSEKALKTLYCKLISLGKQDWRNWGASGVSSAGDRGKRRGDGEGAPSLGL